MSTNERTEARTTIRRWIRSDVPTMRWWPWGLLAVLGLLLVVVVASLYVAPSIVEAQTENGAQGQLNAAGMDWARARADGQELTITGNAPTTVTPQLLASVKQAASLGNCEWFGCEVVVDLRSAPTATATATAAPRAAEPATSALKPGAPDARHHDFLIQAHGSNVVLTGEVADESARRAAGLSATKQFESVDNKLVVSGENATPMWPAAAERGLATLALLESGTATWKSGALAVRGEVAEDKDTTARDIFGAETPVVKLGSIDLVIKEAADRCDALFATALSRSTIRFATNSAAIAPSSRKLLGVLAKTAKQCPGGLEIEGHTDSVGKPESNRTLSRARASAVAKALSELGVSADRLEAKGLGADKPIASNKTNAGKAKNRRIEVRIKR